MDEEQGLQSPLAGGLRGIRRSVSSSVFTGRAVPPPVRGDNISNNLISQNSLALSNVSIQLGGIADQVRSVNSSLAIIKDNLAISDELEKKKEFEKRKREAQLAEEGLREGKESELEKKIQFALLAPVRRVAQVARGILSRLGESLLYLAGGWLTSQALKFLQLNSEGNVEALKKFKDRFLKDLLIIGGIFLAATVGLGKVFTLVKGLGAFLSRVTFGGFIFNAFKGLGAFILNNVGKFINFIKSGVGRILGFGLGGFNPNLLVPGAVLFEKRIRKFLEKTPLIGRFFRQKVPVTTTSKGIVSTRTGVFGKILGNSLILLFETLNAFSQKQLLIAAGLEPFQAFITSFARAFGQFALFTGFVKATSLAVGGVFAGLGALLGLAGGPFAPLTVGVGAAKGFAVGKAVGGVLGTLAFFFPEKTKQLTGGLVDIQKFKESTDKVSTEIGMSISGVDKKTKDRVRGSAFFGKIDGNFSEEDNSQNVSGEKSDITGAQITGGEVVPFKTNKNGENLELSDSTANIIDATSGSNFKPGRFGFTGGNDNNDNEVPTISSSNENDYQPILVDYYTNINNP